MMGNRSGRRYASLGPDGRAGGAAVHPEIDAGLLVRSHAQIAARLIKNDALSGEIRPNGFGRRIPRGVHRGDFRLDGHDMMNEASVERFDLKFII